MKSYTYNGKTIEEIENNMMPMPKVHKDLYISGVKRVIECKRSGYNLNEIEVIKTFNHKLYKLYLSGELK